MYYTYLITIIQLQQPIGPTESSIVGIPALKYKLEDNTFDNGEVNKKNKCFCTLGRCLPRGLFDISSCYYGNVSYS